jgi:hypothetical protein
MQKAGKCRLFAFPVLILTAKYRLCSLPHKIYLCSRIQKNYERTTLIRTGSYQKRKAC